MQGDMDRASLGGLQWALGVCEIIEWLGRDVVLGDVVFSNTGVDFRVAGKPRAGFRFTCNLVRKL